MRITIAFNPVSGRGAGLRTAEALQQRLLDRGHDVELVASKPGGGDWIAPGLKEADALAVVGGDGTVRLVVAQAASTGVPLLHVPLGTENLLARGLGLSRRLETVVDTLERGDRVSVDLGRANGEPMLLMASVGLDAAVVAEVSRRRGRSISKWIYVRAMLRCLPRWRAPLLDVQVDGRMLLERVHGWVVVANAPDYGGRFDPAPQARMNDGLLDVVVLPCRGPLGFLAWGLRSRLGRHLHHRDAIVASGRSVRIQFRDTVHAQIDGDLPWGRRQVETLQVDVDRGALQVIVPPEVGPLRALTHSLAGEST